MTCILVPPNRYRPEARTGESQIAEAQQNSLYKSILRSCGKIAQVYGTLADNRGHITQMHQAWTELQDGVNSLIDKTKNPVQGAAAARNEGRHQAVAGEEGGPLQEEHDGETSQLRRQKCHLPGP